MMCEGTRLGAPWRGRRAVALFLAGTLSACFYHSPIHTVADEDLRGDIAEIKDGQTKILEKLAAIETGHVGRRPAAAPAVDYSKVHEFDLGDSPVRGEPTAPVTIVEFSDYQCPFCAQVEPLIHQILEENKGKAKLVFKNFPLETIHAMARPAALAAMAAGAQGRYWQMHDALFELKGQIDEEKILGSARKIGLDMGKFETDRKSAKLEELLKTDVAQAQRAGVRGTPTFFVNGRRVVDRGAEGFKRMIEEALQK